MDSKEVEWFDADIYVNGAKITKCQGFKYKQMQEKELLYAAGNKAISIQRGNKSGGGELRFLKGAIDALNATARTAGGQNLLDITCVVVIAYRAKGVRTLNTDTLMGLEFTEYEKGMEQNAKSMPVSLPMLYLDQLEA